MAKFLKRIPVVYKFIIAFVVLLASFGVTAFFGAADTTMRDVWAAFGFLTKTEAATLIREIRLPRETAAVFVGAALAVSGALMQGVTRNPLADPGLLGLTAGANAALALTLAFWPGPSTFVIMLACFIGASVGMILVIGIGGIKKGGLSPFRIVLAGAAVSAFLEAVADGTGLYFKLSKDVKMWTAGGLTSTVWHQLEIVVPFILVGIVIALLFSRHLTVLSLNQDIAVGLGQKTATIKTCLFLAIILLAGASVALAGNLAFLGLMIPHIVRALVGPDYRFIVPMSAIAGAVFMLWADTLSRTMNAPYETPVAAIIAIFGLPFFLLVVHKGGRAFS